MINHYLYQRQLILKFMGILKFLSQMEEPITIRRECFSSSFIITIKCLLGFYENL
jgi:hypothetical protein